MPLVAYRITPEGREPDPNNRLWRLLNFQPNRYQTRTEFLESIGLNLAATGNSYAAIQRNARGDIIGLLPLMSSQMSVILLPDGEVTYQYIDAAGNMRVYSAQSIWHIKLFGNGIVGYSPLQYARHSIGTALATDKRSGELARNGGKATGVLMVDKVLTPEQRDAVRKNFKELAEGGSDQLFVLEADMKYQQVSLSPLDAQLLETRRFQVEDIARFMGVPSVLINDTKSSTTWGSGIQQIVTGWYKLGLRPYLERIESSITRHLLPLNQWGKIELQFNFDALLRVDEAQRYEGYNKAINSGFLAPNEARKKEGLPAKDGADELLVNGNMRPLGAVEDEENQA